jgi:hypothetical protein
VDYAVGITAGTSLTPIGSVLGAGVSLSPTNGLVRCISPGSTITLTGVEFGSASIYDEKNGCRWIVRNSHFGCPVNYANVISDDVDVQNSEFDQGGCAGPSSFITGSNVTVKRNWFRRGYQHVVESGGPGAIVIQDNLIDDMVPGGSATGQHENFHQLSGTARISSDVVSGNFAYQHTPGSGNGEGWQFYCNSGPCEVDNPILTNNVTVTLPGTRMSYVVNGGDPSKSSYIVNGTNRNNYFDLRGAYGAYYPGTMTPAKGWTSSGNIDLNSGKTITPG